MKNPEIAKKIGTAAFSICLTTIDMMPLKVSKDTDSAGKVWIPTTIIIAIPRKKSKYALRSLAGAIILLNQLV